MDKDIERNFGEQPLSTILDDQGLDVKALVTTSTEHLTYKMVTRACKGRRLTSNSKCKIRDALNAVSGKTFSLKDLFNY